MWDVLAIAPTDDPKAIRRAYAARLRQIDPDRERETFAQLRQALEWALAGATAPPRPSPAPPPPTSAHDPVPEDPPPSPPPVRVETAPAPPADQDVRICPVKPATVHRSPPPPRPPAPSRAPPPPPAPPSLAAGLDDRASDRALLIALETALQRGDADEAAQLYVRAAATAALPLGEAEHMLALLFEVALRDATFDGTSFRALAKTFGWDRPELGSPMMSEVRRRVTSRLAAEEWYDALVALADRKRWLLGRRKSRIARLLLRRIRGRGLLRIDRPALRVTLDTLRPHEVWLRDRIPREWVATLEQRLRRRELFASRAVAAFMTLLLLHVALVIGGGAVGLIVDGNPVLGVLTLVAFAVVMLWMLRLVVKHFFGMWRSPT